MHVNQANFQKVEVQLFAQKTKVQISASLPCLLAHGRSFLRTDASVAREYMMRFAVYLLLPRDINVLSDTASLGRVARVEEVVNEMTELLFALLSTRVDR